MIRVEDNYKYCTMVPDVTVSTLLAFITITTTVTYGTTERNAIIVLATVSNLTNNRLMLLMSW